MDPPKTQPGHLLKLVAEVAEELHPDQGLGRNVTLDSSLDRDLAFDSLGRVELVLRVEKTFGVSVPERTFATMETPRDLLGALRKTGGDKGAPSQSPTAVAPLGKATAVPPDVGTLVAALEWHASQHPDRPHLRLYADEDDGEVLTYGQLQDGATAIARGLLQQGVQPSEAVVIMLPTSRAYFETFFGVLLAGGVPAPIYPPTRPSQIEDHLRRHASIVANCGARILIVDEEAKPVAQLLRAQVETLQAITTPGQLAQESGFGDVALPRREPQDLALLQYTSGSTGTPKGVVLTHGNLMANIRSMAQAMAVTPDDVFVSWLPLYHDMGLIGAWLGSLVQAVHLVIMPPLHFLARPQRWLRAIHRYRGTMSAAPNFAYELCLRRLDDAVLEGLDLSSWRIACNGAEPVSPQTVQRFCDRFASYGFRKETMMPVYGLAECSVGLAFPPLDRGPLIDRLQREPLMASGKAMPAAPDDRNALHFVACGRPIPQHEVRIVDATGHELPERTEGRLQFRGPSTTQGYLHNPEQSKDLFDGDWLNAGDLAYIAGGDIFITGRSKDIIIHAGRNIYPEEIEEAVGDLAGIQKGSVAVFGSTDAETGTERLVVLAESRRTAEDSKASLRAQINGMVVDLIGSPPDDIVLAPPRTVLKTSSGKIRRAASREVYEQGAIGRRHAAMWLQLTRITFAAIGPQLRRLFRDVGAVAYATVAWAVFGLAALPIWLGVVLSPRPLAWRILRTGLKALARVMAVPMRLSGSELIPAAGTPCIYVCNHASYLDGLVLAALLPHPVSFVVKAELAALWSTRIPMQRLQVEFVERFDMEKGEHDAQRITADALAGQSPLYFAEGTTTRIPGLLPFHMGAFLAAAETGLRIVPVAIRGTRSMLRPDSWFPRRGAISVVVGEPVDPTSFDVQDRWQCALRLRDAARAHILQYCGEPDRSLERSPI